MMYNQSVLRPSPRGALHSHLGRGGDLRSCLPKPLVDKRPFKGGGKTPPSRALPKEKKDQLLKRLTPVQYKVTQEKVTER